MPELPEVECVARSLDSLLSGRSILTARLLRERLAPSISSDEFTQRLSAATIDRVHRRGKHILFDLDNGRTLVTHLRMSGTFMLLTREREDPKFTHAVFDLADGNRLVFRDQRHFGFMNVVETNLLFESRELKRLAPEPFSDSFTPAYVLSTSQRSKRNIKEVLLDQTKFCGLGNIYASEALHMARINPVTPANRISRRKAAALHSSIREVLHNAISKNRSAEVDPENLNSAFYSNGAETGWLVYDREHAACYSCQRPIKRIKQGGRSTYYCSSCQRIA